MVADFNYLLEIFELDSSLSIEVEVQKIESILDSMQANPDDDKPAYLTIVAGSGGREACNWAEMLLRMYAKYLSKHGLSAEFVDFVPNDPDGIKTVTLYIVGHRAFGLLKNETGVHRLSRVSPFDQADRRQTSFAAVEVTAEAVEEDEFSIDEKDIDVYYCCGSGPGGQAINKTEVVAVVKHLPTGIIVRSQKTRCQQQNKINALTLLKSRLIKMKEEEQQAKQEAIKKAAPKAAFGNEYRRTYVLSQHPGINDHLTGKKTIQIQSVLDGEINLLY